MAEAIHVVEGGSHLYLQSLGDALYPALDTVLLRDSAILHPHHDDDAPMSVDECREVILHALGFRLRGIASEGLWGSLDVLFSSRPNKYSGSSLECGEVVAMRSNQGLVACVFPAADCHRALADSRERLLVSREMK